MINSINSEPTYCGFVALVGKSNVGKSTLLNKLVGEKISITANKLQTTRHKILGVKTQGNKQVVYIDTPGICTQNQNKLNKLMNKTARSVFADVDLIIFMVESLSITKEDRLVLEYISKLADAPEVFLVISKSDLVKDSGLLLPQVKQLTDEYEFTKVLPVSARNNINLQLLEDSIFAMLPESPHYFAKDSITDQNLNFRIAEIIREKLIKNVDKELPYVTNVEIEQIKKIKKTYHIDATIWVEKVGQKKIIVGSRGSKLKTIGSLARVDLESLLQAKVFLTLFVKVKSNWTNDDYNLKSLNIN